jgi:TonB family protein
MSAEAPTQAAGRIPAALSPATASANTDRRRFWIGLACAALLHAALIGGFFRAPPRIMGERDGQPDGLSVELVDAADLKSRSAVQAPADSPPPAAGETAQPSPPAPASPPPSPAPAPATAALPQEVAAPPGGPAPPPLPHPGENERSSPAEKSPPAEKRPAARQPAKPRPPLQLSLPSGAFAPGGLGAAVERPPGVTRTGENDEFGRGVIRALRKTMPPPSGTLGRVTVRLFLNENGNLQNLTLVRGSDDAPLNQSVMFAARQTSFPIPPVGATVADRTFLVTYVYR